ncbi:TolC family protein [Thermoproteota archaeon]
MKKSLIYIVPIYIVIYLFTPSLLNATPTSNSSSADLLTANSTTAEPVVMTLDDCINQALNKNSQLIIAKENQSIAESATGEAWSTVFPKLTLEYSISRISSLMQSKQFGSIGDIFSDLLPTGTVLPDTLFPDYFDTYSLKLSVSQVIFGTHVLPVLDASKYGLQLAKELYTSQENTTIFQTKQAYYNVLKAEALYKAGLENYHYLNKLITLTKEMVNVGVATKSDLLRQQVQLKAIEQSLLSLKHNFQLAKAHLNITLNNPIDTELKLEDNALNTCNHINSLDYNQFRVFSEKNRPEIKAMDYQVDLYKTQVAVTESKGLPSVYLSGYFGLADQVSGLDWDKDQDWMVSVAAQWLIFDGNEVQSQVRAARSDVKKSQEERNSIVLNVLFETKMALDSLKLAYNQIGAAKAEVEFAFENSKTAQERFSSGTATNLELLDSQTALLQAKAHWINAKYDYQIAKAKLQQVIGTDQETLEALIKGDLEPDKGESE